MALDLHGFVAPTDRYEGLYKVGDDIQRNKQLQEQKAQRTQADQERQDARKTASAAYLQSYLNPKHFLTGTNEDAAITDGISKVLQKGMALVSQGVDTPSVTMALSGDVADIAKASDNLKAIEAQRKEAEKHVGTIKGIDLDKFNNAYKDAAFYNTDANGNKTLKDLSAIDPSQPYGDMALKGDVYNRDSIDDFISKAGKSTTSPNYKFTDSHGRMTQTKVDVTKPDFMISDVDSRGVHQGFVPKYNIATDGESELIHTFKDDKGNDVKAPVRMITDDVWDSLPKTAKAYAVQETRNLIKNHPNIKLSDPQSENLAKTIMYDELKNSGKQWSTYKPTTVQKEAPAPRVSITVNNSKSGSDVPMVDIYKSINAKANSHMNAVNPMISKVNGKPIAGALAVNSLDDNEQSVILKKAKEAIGNDTTIGDIYLMKQGGDLWIMQTKNDKAVTKLSQGGTNLSANQSLGVKSKQKAVTEAQNAPKHKMSDDEFNAIINKIKTGK